MSDPSEQPATVTAHIKLTAGGLELEAAMTVPTRRIPLRLMLPMAHALSDATVHLAERQAAEEGKAVSCKKGCGACCRQLVPIAQSESRQLRELVNDLPEPRRSVIRARFAEARRRLEGVGLWQKLDERYQWEGPAFNQLGLEYFAQGVPCPFLEEESCSIHPDRPSSCREYLVTSPAAECARPTAETIRMVPLPARVWTALARLDGTAPGAKFIGWVPLIQSLAWAEAHPDEPAERPGPEWLQELFNHMNARKAGEGPGAPPLAGV
jgi:Fe-S-cluster containining protein